ncbi:Nicotinate-nucleotide--dimethylbenzimidazole phosphoribosyltransferase, partial [Geodia barretti]
TKPPGALGVVEAVAAQIARVQNTLTPELRSCRLTLFAGDHGIAAESVSAYPQAVTRQMVANFLAGGAAANVFARTNGVELQVVSRRIAAGTRNFAVEPAMTAEQCETALRAGEALGVAVAADTAAFGEMGIGNTSSATLVAHKLTGTALDSLVGRGAGLDDAGLSRKQGILEQAARRTAAPLDARDALREYGGFEMVMMAGAMMGAARAGAVVLVDGFIASVAALAATEMAPPLRDYLVFGHRSAEHGHGVVLAALDARPLLELDMRLGEGTGALLAWPVLKCAAAMLSEMASFESAGVSGPV